MLTLSLLAAATLAAQDTVRLVVVATADVHGVLSAEDEVTGDPRPGGLARAATVIDSLRQRYPGQVVLVDAGDALQGSLLAAYVGRVQPREPHSVVDAMNALGYDVATPGDHDFDFGAEPFTRAIANSAFPWVSANLRGLPKDTLALRAWQVVERNGVRIAVTGVTTTGAMVSNGDRLRDRFWLDRPDAALESTLRLMRAEADLVVVLAHSGLSGPSSYDTAGLGPEQMAARLAALANPPDLVVAGHSHAEIADSVISGVHFVQPRPEARGLAVVHVALVARGGRLAPVSLRGQRVPLEKTRPSPRIERRLAEAVRLARRWATTTLAKVERELPAAAARVEDTPLYRFLHNVMRSASGARLSLLPVFDVRGGFDINGATNGAVFRLYPAEYTLRAVRVTGAELQAALEQSARYFYSDSTGLVAPNRYVAPADYELLGGARYVLDLSRPPGSRVRALVVDGKQVLAGDTFTLALSSYRQRGGGNYGMFARAPVVYDEGVSIRDLIAAEVSKRGTLRAADFAGRDWAIIPKEYAARARALFVRGQRAEQEDEADEPGALGFAVLTPTPVPGAPRPAPAADPTPVVERRGRVTVARLAAPADSGRDGGLARLLADAYRTVLRADVALVAGSEVPGRLPSGEVAAEDLRAAVPGNASLLSFSLTGDELKDILENLAAAMDPCCQLSGLTVEYNPRAKEGERVRRIRFFGDQDWEGKRRYRLAISSVLVDGDSVFPLAAGDCRPGKGCRRSGSLARWRVERHAGVPAGVLEEYLKRLGSGGAVRVPGDSRFIPVR